MIETVFKILGGVIVIILVAGVGLNEIKGTPDTSLVTRNTVAQAILEEKADSFAICDHSLKLGSVKVSDVSLSYLRFDSTDQEKQQIKDTEKKFMDQVHKQCDPIIKDYGDNFEAYKQTSREIQKAQASLFDRMINKDLSVPDSEFAQYEPSYASMTKGGSGYSFTDDEVKRFYVAEIGY